MRHAGADMVGRRGWLWAAAAAAAALAAAAAVDLTRTAPAPSSAVRGASGLLASGPAAEQGLLTFAHGDMGALDLDTLDTNALPWRAVVAALALREAGGDPARASPEGARTALRRVGFLFPDRIANAPDLPGSPEPLGVSVGLVERTLPPLRVTVANLGCAACHAGVTYDPAGRPLPGTAWLGMPNTSLDLEAYARLVLAAMKAGLADEPALLSALDRIAPGLSWRERLTLRWLVLPRAAARLRQVEASGGEPLPFPNGAPGLTNGVAALKSRLGVPPNGPASDGPGYVSIPDLGSVLYRSALLADGAYAAKGEPRFRPLTAAEAASRSRTSFAGVVSFFVVPSMGLTSARAEGNMEALGPVIDFLARYRPQPFPGAVDAALAGRGRGVYAAACASCHGVYDDDGRSPRLLSFPNWHGDVGTDLSRAKAFTPDLAQAVGRTRHGAHIDAASTGGYLAPPLTGIWASAPYFVNGSVPTLRHLLEPATRPHRFPIGGHALDLARVGVALEARPDGSHGFPDGYVPFSTPVVIDTARPGFSNRGHEAQVEGLRPEEREALLEYLKLL